MAVMFQVEVFWVLTQCSVEVGYQRFRGPCRLHIEGEDGGRTYLWNVGFLPQHYTASQTWRRLLMA